MEKIGLINRIMTQQRRNELNKELMDTVVTLAQKYPMPPEVADALRFGFGAEKLKSWGFNLSEAEAAYGPGWLSR